MGTGRNTLEQAVGWVQFVVKLARAGQVGRHQQTTNAQVFSFGKALQDKGSGAVIEPVIEARNQEQGIRENEFRPRNDRPLSKLVGKLVGQQGQADIQHQALRSQRRKRAQDQNRGQDKGSHALHFVNDGCDNAPDHELKFLVDFDGRIGLVF